MAYTQQTWQDGVTPVDAERMNHIEGGVADLSDQIDELNMLANFFEAYNITSSSYDLNDDTYTDSYYKCKFLYVYTDTLNVPRSGNGLVLSYGARNYAIQIYLGNSTSAGIWVRFKENATWKDWSKVL